MGYWVQLPVIGDQPPIESMKRGAVLLAYVDCNVFLMRSIISYVKEQKMPSSE